MISSDSMMLSKIRPVSLALAALLPLLGGSGCKVDPAKASLSQIFAKSRKANLPVVLAKVVPGMPTAAATIVEPDVMRGDDPSVRYRDGLVLQIFTSKERREIQRLQLVMGDKDAPQVITSAWGEPVKGAVTRFDVATPASYWHDPEKGFVATMTSGESGETLLDFEPYVPFVRLFGTSKEPFEIEGRPVLGLTRDEVKAARKGWLSAWPSHGDDILTLDPPRTEFGTTSMVVSFGKDGKAERFSVIVHYDGNPPFKADVLSAVKARLGEPKIEKDYEGKDRMVWGTDPKIELSDDEKRKRLNFSAERAAR
jgi:hypothetical protein